MSNQKRIKEIEYDLDQLYTEKSKAMEYERFHRAEKIGYEIEDLENELLDLDKSN
jgi:hypothetical protein|tara:strand:+ start:10032 stop:10196 length:165 start_codon:yes stop_codon:yes gene_type:complete